MPTGHHADEEEYENKKYNEPEDDDNRGWNR